MRIKTLNPGKGMPISELKLAYFESSVSDRNSFDFSTELFEFMFKESLSIHLANGKIVETSKDFYVNSNQGKYCLR